MEMDLNSRSAKWKREQEKQKERARRQLQTEALRRAAAEKARAELEAVQAQKRIERLQEQERMEQLALEEQRLTGGIKYTQRLRAVPTTSDGDKITLPVSALETLNPQNAFDLGAFTFELTYGESKTHAGVLEFVAEEGTVGLPPKVAASLLPSGSNGELMIGVRYVRLEKGTFASLQPKGDGFGDREFNLKKTLERSLKAHTTLTVGDTLFVRHGRETFEVAVVELRPESAVNILNTDLEVALLPSETIMKAKEEEQRRHEAAARALEMEKEKERMKEQKLQALTPEPPMEERAQAKVVLRMPDGTQTTRRFAHTATLRAVYELVEALTGDGAQCFHFVATYPRRVFGADVIDKTLAELGLNGRQESLFVERIAASVATDSNNEGTKTTPGLTHAKTLGPDWEAAKHVLEKALDEALHANLSTPIHALEPILPVTQASDQQTKWQAQLKELAVMGFENRELNIQLLERYQGRLLRVVNFLSELASEPSTAETREATAMDVDAEG